MDAGLYITVEVLGGTLTNTRIPFSTGRRAIHDLATGSIVIIASAENDFVRWTQENEAESLQTQADPVA